MGDREKEIAEGMARLPKELQDKFAEQITGAAMAIDMLAGAKAGKKEKTA